MRAVLWAVVAAGLAWAGYWVVGSRAIASGVTDWFATAPANGIDATTTDISVAGFPNRFDLTLTDLHLGDALSGISVNLPFAQVFTMTWKPWHLIAVLPHEAAITVPGQTIALTTTDLRGSLSLHPGTDLALNRIVIEAAGIKATADQGWTVSADKLVLASAEDTTWQHAQRLGLELTNLTPDASLTDALPDLGPVISAAHLDATVMFSGPIDRHLADTPAQVTGISLHDAHVTWGTLNLTASGDIARGSDAFAEGEIIIRIENWRALPRIIVALGLVKPEIGPTIEHGLEVVAKSGKDPEVLTLPLTFHEGRMTLGPLPLGEAPKLN